MRAILSVLSLELVIRSTFADSPLFSIPATPSITWCEMQNDCPSHLSCSVPTLRCDVRCIGINSCIDTVIDCGQSESCLVYCAGLGACRNITVNGTSATAVELKCVHPATCFGIELRCSPPEASEGTAASLSTCKLTGMYFCTPFNSDDGLETFSAC